MKNFNLIIRLIIFLVTVGSLSFISGCKKDEVLVDPASDTPSLSFTFNGKKYSYKSNGIKDTNGKVADAFGYFKNKQIPVADYKTYAEVNGTSGGDKIIFKATYNSGLPLEGDVVNYSLTVGSVIYTLQNTVTLKAGKNYLKNLNGKTANFFEGEFTGDFATFTSLGTVQKVTVADGTFLVTRAADQ